MSVEFKFFKGAIKSWGTLFQEAANFAGFVGKERLINISHSAAMGDYAVVTVWYWSE